MAGIELPTLSTWIGGAAEPSVDEDRTSLDDPNTGSPLQQSRSSSPEQVDRAIAAASRAHESGALYGLGASGRAEALRAFADELETDVETIAVLDSLNSGVPITTTRLFAGSLAGTVRAAADRVEDTGDIRSLAAGGREVTLRRVPWGPSALVIPWNAPAALTVKKLAFCLAAGSAAVIKPSEASPWSAQLIVAAAVRAGLPAGSVNLVLGARDVGEQLVADPRIRAVAMTGSTPTGRAIARAAGPNFTRLRLELGSNNPAIVRADADLALTAKRLASGAMKLSGQWCEAPRRVIVHAGFADDLVDALATELERFRLGSSLDSSTDVGPVAFRARRDALEQQREELVASGARSIVTARVADDGWFFAPTVVVANGPELGLDAELFGPIIAVQTAEDDDAAVDLANTGLIGLAGYVFSRDLARARELGERLRAGEVKVNGTSVLDMAVDSAQSFFGDAGLGGHGDAELLEFFTGQQVLGTDDPDWSI